MQRLHTVTPMIAHKVYCNSFYKTKATIEYIYTLSSYILIHTVKLIAILPMLSNCFNSGTELPQCNFPFRTYTAINHYVFDLGLLLALNTPPQTLARGRLFIAIKSPPTDRFLEWASGNVQWNRSQSSGQLQESKSNDYTRLTRCHTRTLPAQDLMTFSAF